MKTLLFSALLFAGCASTYTEAERLADLHSAIAQVARHCDIIADMKSRGQMSCEEANDYYLQQIIVLNLVDQMTQSK